MCIAAAIGGAAVLGAGATMYASNQSSNAQKDAANQANATQSQMFNTITGNEAPYMAAGNQAEQALMGFYGLPTGAPQSQSTQGFVPGGINDLTRFGRGGAPLPIRGRQVGGAPAAQSPQVPNYSQILSNLPGYQFQQQQGELAVQRDLAARGLLQSGAAAKELTSFGQGLAQTYAGQYAQGLQNLSQLGQAAASNTASAGMNAANQIGSNQIYAGNAAAAGYANMANAFGGGLQNLAGAYAYGQSSPQFTAGDVAVLRSGGGTDPLISAGGGYYQNNPIAP